MMKIPTSVSHPTVSKRYVYSALFVVMSCLLSVTTTFAFTPNNRLLNSLYDKVDAMYATSPQTVLNVYKKLPQVKIRMQKNTEVLYYLDKIDQYMFGKLFTFIEQPNFVCLDTYVQKNDTVEIDYTLTEQNGSLVATTLASVAKTYGIPLSEIQNRLAFNPGNDQVMPGMDQLTLGAPLHKRVAAMLEPKDARGVYDEAKIITFSGSLPPEVQVAEVGGSVMMRFNDQDDSYLLLGTVREKTATSARVDFNHPRAGQSVLLSLEVMNLFKACR